MLIGMTTAVKASKVKAVATLGSVRCCIFVIKACDFDPATAVDP